MSFSLVVRVTTLRKNTVGVIPIDARSACPKCQRGEGCGEKLWFHGVMARDETVFVGGEGWQCGDLGRLEISARALNTLVIFAYGLPLILFFVALAVLAHTRPSLQFGLALLIAICGFWVTIPLQKKMVSRALHLVRDESLMGGVIRCKNGKN